MDTELWTSGHWYMNTSLELFGSGELKSLSKYDIVGNTNSELFSKYEENCFKLLTFISS